MTTPISLWRGRVARGELAHDPVQEFAAEQLTLLWLRLKDWRPGKRRSLFGKPEPEPKGLYFFGGVGRGKSMLMDLFFDVAPVAAKRRVHFHAFMQEVHAAVAKEREGKSGDPLPRIAKQVAEHAWLLCFDEFHVTDIADAMLLGRLFDGLFAAGVVVVATSNRPPDDLYEDGINRQLFIPFIETLKDRLEVIELDGWRDYRLESLAAAPVYYAPLGEAADAAMDKAWARITCSVHAEAAVLEVQGREVGLPRAAAGCARASFDDLCATPLGAADYLAIARAFHTLFLDHVPKLGPVGRNEAKRFVTLIDALYETKTKLVMSADAEPGELYAAGDGAFEFERAASRLIEMRGRDYLAAAREQGGEA